MTYKSPFISIVIPVYNSLSELKVCLDALEKQTYSRSAFEVIVVDNCSEEDIKSLVAQFVQAAYTSESTPGSYAARNRGLSIAKGQILGFTDADCIPTPDWIEKGVQRLLETAGCGLVAGRIDFFFKDPDHPTVAELFDSQTFLNQKEYVETENYGATANAFTFKEVFDNVGLFNTKLKSGGDREWGKRVHAAGYCQIYADEVRIYHPARYSIKALKTKVLRIVEGQHVSNSSKQSLASILIEFLKDAKPYLGYAIKTMTDEKTSGFGYKLGLIRIHVILRYVRARKKLQLRLR